MKDFDVGVDGSDVIHDQSRLICRVVHDIHSKFIRLLTGFQGFHARFLLHFWPLQLEMSGPSLMAISDSNFLIFQMPASASILIPIHTIKIAQVSTSRFSVLFRVDSYFIISQELSIIKTSWCSKLSLVSEHNDNYANYLYTIDIVNAAN